MGGGEGVWEWRGSVGVWQCLTKLEFCSGKGKPPPYLVRWLVATRSCMPPHHPPPQPSQRHAIGSHHCTCTVMLCHNASTSTHAQRLLYTRLIGHCNNNEVIISSVRKFCCVMC